MGYGRLIRVSKRRGDPNAVAYVVAVPDPAKAIDLIRNEVGTPGDEVDDLGRVSDALLSVLNLTSGEFRRL